jgi:hypothetical protein
VAPIRESNRVWKEQYERGQRRRKLLAGVGASVGVALVGILFYATWTYLAEYQRTDGAIERLLALNMSDPETARRKAPAVLGDVADYLWQKDKLDHLAELLKRATPVITEQYRMDRRMGDVMPQVADDARWPIELRYYPDRSVDTGRLLYEWRITAARLMDTRGIPVPAALKLTQDRDVPVDSLVVIADELKTSIAKDKHRGIHTAGWLRPCLRERDAKAVASVVRLAQNGVGTTRRCPERRRAVVASATLDPAALRGRGPSAITTRGGDRLGGRTAPDRAAGTGT